MSNIEKSIQKRLKALEVQHKKQITISLRTECIDQLDTIARTLSRQSGRSTSRNMIIEDAIDAYTQDAMQIFEEEGIEIETSNSDDESFDTVIFPAHEEGFRKAFLDENKWYYVRIRKDRLPNLKYIAIYVGAPISKITHYAKIAQNGFEYNENEKKYLIHFEGQAIELENPVPLGGISAASTRAPKYTTLQKLLMAEQYKDL